MQALVLGLLAWAALRGGVGAADLPPEIASTGLSTIKVRAEAMCAGASLPRAHPGRVY